MCHRQVTDAMRNDVTAPVLASAVPADVELVPIAVRQFPIVVRFAAVEYARFATLRDIVRQWRHDGSLRFCERSIGVVERVPARAGRPRPPGRRDMWQ